MNEVENQLASLSLDSIDPLVVEPAEERLYSDLRGDVTPGRHQGEHLHFQAPEGRSGFRFEKSQFACLEQNGPAVVPEHLKYFAHRLGRCGHGCRR